MDDHSKLDRSILFLSKVPFFGLVEKFDESLVRLHYYLRVAFPEVKVQYYAENVLQTIGTNIDEKLVSIKSELGDNLYRLLLKSNELDIVLYDYAWSTFDKVGARSQAD